MNSVEKSIEIVLLHYLENIRGKQRDLCPLNTRCTDPWWLLRGRRKFYWLLELSNNCLQSHWWLRYFLISDSINNSRAPSKSPDQAWDQRNLSLMLNGYWTRHQSTRSSNIYMLQIFARGDFSVETYFRSHSGLRVERAERVAFLIMPSAKKNLFGRAQRCASDKEGKKIIRLMWHITTSIWLLVSFDNRKYHIIRPLLLQWKELNA